MKQIIAALLTLVSAFSISLAQVAPKREFRAAWIATVSNIDWPSKPGLPAYQQQQEFIHHLDLLKKLGCNAVIVQIRPASDALYKSDLEPWSRFLTGRVGQPPFPYYDPLPFMILEAQKRNMEFHAWFNPFRGLTQSDKNPNPPEHVTKKYPQWLIHYGGKGYLDPGNPDVRAYVIKVIMDVVKRYDIDAVHIDDYFYPYRIAGLEFGDAKSFALYKGAFTNKEDWRRNNVNEFIKTLYKQIHDEKAYVKFGISPFGVWRNASKDPRGSTTRGGQTCYDDLYSDILLWMQKGWVDYVAPQLYWERGHRAAPFEVLLPWWEKNSYNRHLYYGLGVYRMLPPVKHPWTSPSEILGQIKDIRKQSAHAGFIFYSTSNFYKIGKALQDSLTLNTNSTIAFPPVMKWLSNTVPATPILTKVVGSKEGNLLLWNSKAESGKPVKIAVYRFKAGEAINLDNAAAIIALLTPGSSQYLDTKGYQYPGCRYVITALDRLWNESKPSQAMMVAQ